MDEHNIRHALGMIKKAYVLNKDNLAFGLWEGELSVIDQYDVVDVDVDDSPSNSLMIEGLPTGLEKIYDWLFTNLEAAAMQMFGFVATRTAANLDMPLSRSSRPKGSTAVCPELQINKLLDLGIEAEAAARRFCLPLDQFSIDAHGFESGDREGDVGLTC
ncbi:hypothetical protein F5Y19DRAFT_472342 [Xylariaceae sp. FL1651]|nr:hypothetical protein F5Y19DRAFT_472342 [Xylariaceae sp. FL1651]